MAKKVINCMSVEEVVDRIPRLFNLMSLADVIPEGTTVYDTDSGDMLDLVPTIRGAREDLQWLLDRAGVADSNGATGDDGEASKRNGDTSTFVLDFISHANEVDAAMGKFIKWFDQEVNKVTPEDIERVLKCGDPAIGVAERRLLEGALFHKRVEKIAGKRGAICICHD